MTDSTVGTDLSKPLYGASFGQAVSRFFKKYATFSGRASRSEYWWVALFLILVNGVLGGIFGGVVAATGEAQADGSVQFGAPGVIVAVIWAIVGIAIIIPSIAITVRRLHDGNFSGWLYLLHLIPSLGSLIIFILTLLPSNPEGARYDK